MKVKIISGTYGHKVGKYIEPKDRQSEPFEVDDAEAKRIIALGIAEMFVEGVATSEKPQNESGANANPSEQENAAEGENEGENTIEGNLDAKQLETLTIKELKKLADDMGIDTSKMKVKADYINAIVAETVEAPVDDGEAPPDLSAEAPLV